MKLEYIASALNYVWVGGLETKRTEEVNKEINRVTAEINKWDPEHKFGVLFNAYAEPQNGQLSKDFFSPYTVQADSGGLQMITLGHTPTPELRKEVYNVQAKYASHAMSFDEIPLRVPEGRGSFGNFQTRFYDRSMVDECARQSAFNIIEQVETFDRLNSSCKPYLIIQGNDFETYQYWTDIILKYLPDDIISKIHGIAVGGGCLGRGTLEDIEKYFTMSHLNAPDSLLKNFHILGVGAPNRIVTLAKMSHLFDKDVNISYDSTKHTGGIPRAQIQIGHQCVCISSRQRNKRFNDICEKFLSFAKEKLSYNFAENEVFEAIMNTAEERYAKHGQPKDNLEYTFRSNYIRFALLAFSIFNMFEVIHHVKNDKFIKTTHDESKLNTLSKITGISEFVKWKNEVGRYFPSKRVTCIGSSQTLEGFFE